MSVPLDARPRLTPRMKRGLRLCEQEAELRARRSELDRRRAFDRHGNRRSPGLEAEAATVRTALEKIAVERERLLAQIEAELLPLRAKQSEYDRARAAARLPRRLKKIQVSKAEQKLRKRMAALQRERAYVDGTTYRGRESAKNDEAVWSSSHDPETFDSGDR
ncbi:hypothetical protein [Actinocorallia populi]|uniref:hypothetical protein n=1 Tax=Actinocorallia populi TaxID=2079200 RepID=UPI000D09152E|nr:hypothetical protein [Actinocorallia populi]